jgi:hypothetical protein
MAVGLNVTGKLRVLETLIPWLNDENNGEKKNDPVKILEG